MMLITPKCNPTHQWVEYVHGWRRCVACLEMERTDCRCEDCGMSRKQWIRKHRREQFEAGFIEKEEWI